MDIKGVIFDLDGVIISTDRRHYQAWKRMADEENIYFDEEINNRLRGVSRMQSLDIVLQNANIIYSDDEKNQLSDKKNRYYVEYLSSLSDKDILPGVMDVLEKLKNNGVKIAIGSSSKNAATILKRIGLSNYFDAVVDGNEIINSKPDPEVFLLAAKKLKILPQNLMVVEDALAGIDAANSADMTSVLVSDAVDYGKATYSLEFIRDLLSIVDGT